MAADSTAVPSNVGRLNVEAANAGSTEFAYAATSPMNSAALALLTDIAATFASASAGESGTNSAVVLLRKRFNAHRVSLEVVGDGAATAHEDSANGEAGSSAEEWTVPLVVGGTEVGRLLVVGAGVSHDEVRPLLPVIADMLAVSLAQEMRTRSLEHEVVARVREVAEQRQFIERVVDSLPVGLYVVDRDYRIHAWNRKRETGLQGVSRDEAIGRTIFDVLHRQPAALLKREFDEVFATGRLQQFQMESSATGDVRTFRISKIPMRLHDERVTHVITIGEDITDWRAALDRTAQTEKLAALGQLAAGVMHEINNPLATIAACAESLVLLAPPAGGAPGVGETVPAERTSGFSSPVELLNIIDLEVQRCKRIVNGLLDFARPKPASREVLDLNAVVRQGLFLLQHHPRFKRVKVVTSFEDALPILVNGDADQLVQVLLALAINALDATPDGMQVTIRCQLLASGDGPLQAVLEVSDEGPGVPRAHQSKVFEPFFTTKAPGKGTGLGLAICYGIVSDHGGVLELAASEAPGATFRMLLPAVR